MDGLPPWTHDLASFPPDDFGETRHPDAPGALGLIARDLGRALRADGALLAVGEPDGPVDVLAAWGTASARDRRPPPRSGFVGHALAFETTVIEPLDRDDDSLGVIGPGTRLTHAVAAPVRPLYGRNGVLCAGFADGVPGDVVRARWLVEGYATLMALHLHDREALDRLLTGSHVDGLTGCLTQSAFAQELHREVRRSARHNLRTSCCFIDLDRFKRINDRHGHLQGSRVLADVATLLHEGVRCEDTLGRYGGDEFALLAPDTDEAAAVGLAERLRTTIAAARLNEHDDPIDLSIGVAQWQPGSSAQDLLGAADQALLAAKAAGGAVVVTASELERRPLPSRLRRRRPRAEDVKEVRRVRFCGRCGQRSPLVTSGRVCVKCGLGTLMLAPEDMAPTSREAFLILDEHLAVGAVSRRAESLLGVSESDALDRHIDDLLVPAATGGARVGTVGAVIAPALATADSRHVEVRLARAENGDGPYRARIGSCGPPTGTLVVFTDDHQHGR